MESHRGPSSLLYIHSLNNSLFETDQTFSLKTYEWYKDSRLVFEFTNKYERKSVTRLLN